MASMPHVYKGPHSMIHAVPPTSTVSNRFSPAGTCPREVDIGFLSRPIENVAKNLRRHYGPGGKKARRRFGKPPRATGASPQIVMDPYNPTVRAVISRLKPK